MEILLQQVPIKESVLTDTGIGHPEISDLSVPFSTTDSLCKAMRHSTRLNLGNHCLILSFHTRIMDQIP